jgi:penicillin-binding protein 2B
MRKNKATYFRAGLLIIFFSVIFLIITGRFLYIQVTGEVDGVSLEAWAEERRTSSYTLQSERGKIHDRNGMILAYDRPSYRLYAITEESYSENAEEPLHVEDPRETAEQLAPLLDAEISDIQEPLEKGIEDDLFQVEFGSLGRELSKDEKDKIEAAEIPGIRLTEEPIRYYPNGMFASHIIGFARGEEVENEDGEVQSEITGITGIENELNELLRGEDGFISYQRDKYNRKLLDPNEVVKEPDDGADVYLTLDQKVQTLLEDVLSQVDEEYNPERINAIVMDPKTGEIVAMSSRPSYNPNNPDDVENWYNDAISSPFEPGSTVKMFTWAAAIEEGVYNGDEQFESGSYRVNEKIRPINDHNRGEGWGSITYDEGFERSSNVAASKLVWEKIGTDTFLDYLHAFDFDELTGIDLPGEVPGQILYNWPLEKITTSFGQGTTTTPIQQLKAASAIANEGKMMRPYVMDKIIDPTSGDLVEENEPQVAGEPISADTAEQVLELLELVVSGENGTAAHFQLDDYSVGGKTGTAEIPNPEGGGYLSGRENYIFSFLGMAPIEDPELIMYVSVQQPELEYDEMGSTPVAFIFRNVMENSLRYLNIDPDQENENNQVDTYELPQLTGVKTNSVLNQFEDTNVRYTVVGEGEEIVASNREQGEQVLPSDRVILVTDEPAMPDITGWSLRDVVEFADLLALRLEPIGNGYVIHQHVEEGTPLKEDDYLGVEFAPPGSEEQNEEDNIEEPVEEVEETIE